MTPRYILESLTQMSLLPIGDTHIAFERLGHAGPVIVFKSGLGNDMGSWEAVARPLAAVAQIVLYDRPGIGRSGPRCGTEMLLASTVADELRTCLRAMDMPPPYLLVGHSLGGFYMQAFARTYPRETAAVVLVDSASALEPPGVFGSAVPPKPGSIMAAEEAGFAPSAAAMLAGPPFPPVPLIVLIATEHGVTPDREALWQEVQAHTAALSPKGRLKIMQGASHFIQQERPQVVIEAVREGMREAGMCAELARIRA